MKRDVLSCGDRILNGRYTIIKVLHSSGMSNVYIAKDNTLNKQWCLKEIRKSEAGKNRIEYYALLQEANIMRSLNHTGIPRITSIEEVGDSIFIVMDYIEGISIKDWLVKKGAIHHELAVTWMKQIVQIMMYLHNLRQPILYRDMKPDNVMIQADGNIKVLDFGISVIIKDKNQLLPNALGTRGFAAPEQVSKSGVCDLRSDIYAIGRTLYYMLTGVNPSRYPTKEPIPSIDKVNGDIPQGLVEIVNKCMQQNPDDRYQSCEELFLDLQNYATLCNYPKKRKSNIRKCKFVLGLMGVSFLLMLFSGLSITSYYKKLDAVPYELLNLREDNILDEVYLKYIRNKGV